MKAMHPHIAAAKGYINGILSGEIPACRWVRLACQRQVDDLAKAETKHFPYRFDADKAAQRVTKFIERHKHIKGEWAGKRITLEPWQLFGLTTAFGWVHKRTGLRRFRTVYWELPRKNAKSTITSGVGLYMLTADGEAGAEVYSAATTREQARIVFDCAKAMARKSQSFRDHYGVEVGAHSVHVLSTASKFQALSAEDQSLDGLNIHAALIDELHAHKTRAVYDVLETATGSRRQPLVWCITTAGSNRAGICYEVRTYITKILEGVACDDTLFGLIYTIDDDDDWQLESSWRKANPNYGISVKPDDLARKAAKAMQMPSAVNNFLTKHLNVWVNADTAWMDMRAWDRCKDESLSIEQFVGEPCYVALDLASKKDMAARIALFVREIEGERHFYAFGRYYLPEDAAEDGRNSQYSGWARDGRLVPTPGAVIDFSYIEDDLRDMQSAHELREVPYDPFQATQLSTRLASEGFPMVEFRPTVLNFSEPMKELESLVLSRHFHHDGDPVLAWMASNVVAHLDNKDNIYPKKERPENKIDGIVALISALGRAMVCCGPREPNDLRVF